MNRRQFLAGIGTATVGSLAGCFTPVPRGGGAGGFVPMGGNVAAGGVGSEYAYEEPDLVEADADYTATTVDQLDAALDAGTPEDRSRRIAHHRVIYTERRARSAL